MRVYVKYVVLEMGKNVCAHGKMVQLVKLLKYYWGNPFSRANLELGYDNYLPLSLTLQNVIVVGKFGYTMYRLDYKVSYHFFLHIKTNCLYFFGILWPRSNLFTSIH